jgi:hypothetical protein
MSRGTLRCFATNGTNLRHHTHEEGRIEEL